MAWASRRARARSLGIAVAALGGCTVDIGPEARPAADVEPDLDPDPEDSPEGGPRDGPEDGLSGGGAGAAAQPGDGEGEWPPTGERGGERADAGEGEGESAPGVEGAGESPPVVQGEGEGETAGEGEGEGEARHPLDRACPPAMIAWDRDFLLWVANADGVEGYAFDGLLPDAPLGPEHRVAQWGMVGGSTGAFALLPDGYRAVAAGGAPEQAPSLEFIDLFDGSAIDLDAAPGVQGVPLVAEGRSATVLELVAPAGAGLALAWLQAEGGTELAVVETRQGRRLELNPGEELGNVRLPNGTPRTVAVSGEGRIFLGGTEPGELQEVVTAPAPGLRSVVFEAAPATLRVERMASSGGPRLIVAGGGVVGRVDVERQALITPPLAIGPPGGQVLGLVPASVAGEAFVVIATPDGPAPAEVVAVDLWSRHVRWRTPLPDPEPEEAVEPEDAVEPAPRAYRLAPSQDGRLLFVAAVGASEVLVLPTDTGDPLVRPPLSLARPALALTVRTAQHTERCDGYDDDCDGEVDEGEACVACAPADEACNGLDDDCNGEVDDGLGEVSCGVGLCEATVAACAQGVAEACVPVEPEDPGCDAEPAGCGTTTHGLDGCGRACSKVGPDHCYTVHPACLTSNPGAPTNAVNCTTPRGRYNCGLTCQQWPNSIGADCEHCVNIVCQPRSGMDESQFRCNNLPVPPTP